MDPIADEFRQERVKRQIAACNDINEMKRITFEALELLRNQRILFLDIMNEHMADTVIRSTLEEIAREEEQANG